MSNLKFKKSIIFTTLILAAGMIFSACKFFENISDGGGKKIEITSLALGKTSLPMKVGAMDYVSVAIKPSSEQKNVRLDWSYDTSIIECDTSSAWGVTIKALKEGQTSLRCSYNGYDANCLITVSGYAENYEETIEPYIYSSTSILQTAPGVTERVYVSLYGGSAADIDGYTWTCDNTNVCSIQPTGQYCVITAKEAGYSRIKVTHTKSAYPYYIGVYVFGDTTNVAYITTSNNIVTMNQGDKSQNLSVSLVNGKETSRDSQFSWEVINNGSESPVRFEYNGNNAIVTPIKGGSCTIRVTHPDAAYPLDLLCRVITIVKNVYIKPSSTIVTLSGDATQTVTCSLENIKEGEYDIDAYEFVLDNYNVAEILSSVGNEVTLKGKENGSCKLLVSHEKAAYSREVLLIVNGQLTDAIDASCFITTSQNYIRTKVGADGTNLSVSLKGGEDGDEAGFVWTVTHTASDGSTSNVINLETTHGVVNNVRMASQSYAFGKAYIEPVAEGTAVISVSHPKVYYPTEILVKVLGENAVLDEPLYFAGDGLVRVLNGETYNYTVLLKGERKTTADDNNIKWEIDDSRLSVVPSANKADIIAPPFGTGSTVSNLTISHNKADADKKVLVMTADDEETLMSMKALYSDKLYYNLEIGKSAVLTTNAVGFEKKDGDEEHDFSSATWSVKDPSIASVEKNTYPLMAKVTGLKAGTTTVTISVENCICEYTVTVYPEGAVQTEPEVYFTTGQNVISLSGAGKSTTVTVLPINLAANLYNSITWECENSSVASVVPNGNKATITAVGEGETVVNVTHADSQNTLKIYVRVGSEYVLQDAAPVVYISAEDVMTMLRDDGPQKLDAVLVNCPDVDKSGFSFEIDNEDIAKITAQSTNGTAYIKPSGSGQAEITIRHTKTELAKKVLVVVGNSAEELAGITYLTTGTNVVAVGEGATKTVSVSVKNSEEIVLDGYTWTSSNPGVIGVNSTGATAVFTGNSIGTAVITVSNKHCKYPLQIIAQCVDPIAAAANPYIQLTSSVVTVSVNAGYMNITADLVGGSESDYANFTWVTNDPTICAVYGQNEVGKIRAQKAGTTYITVSHPKAAYSAQLLVVCDEIKQSECYISVPSSIINMKPTDTTQTITASLINGSATDKYNFSWSLDVYDVIDFVYSANLCTISPKQQGQCTITINHPKAAYPQQIVVTVQEYSDFAFPNTNATLTQGDVKFFSMQIPNTRVSTHVEYSVANSSICTVTGTKSTAQLTAVGAGTTTVKAKLVASSTGVVQAESEMLVYVKEASVNAVYITSSSTIYTVKKGKSQTLSGILTGTGVTNIDQYNLEWTTNDSDIIQITGLSSDGTVKGQSIYITALKAGEAVITCRHEKAQSDLQFFVVVPGSADKILSLNKSYMSMVKGSSGTTLKATIENSESSTDYYDIMWSVQSVGENEICRVMGSGQTVTVFPLNVGEAEVMAQLPSSETVARCSIKVEAPKSFSFEQTAVTVQPFHMKKVKYIVSPPSANRTWTMIQADDYFSYTDLGCDSETGVGYVEINGIREGTGNLVCLTDGSAKGQLSIKTSWDYRFSLNGKTGFTITPDEQEEIEFTVNPVESEITISGAAEDKYTYDIINNGNGTGKIIITPLVETSGYVPINVVATNPSTGDTVGQKSLQAKFEYKDVKPFLSIVESDGIFSSLDNDIFTIGDLETVRLKIGFKEKNIDARIEKVSLANSDTMLTVTADPSSIQGSTSGLSEWTLSHNDADWEETELNSKVYKIIQAFVPEKRGKCIDGYWETITHNEGEDDEWDEDIYIETKWEWNVIEAWETSLHSATWYESVWDGKDDYCGIGFGANPNSWLYNAGHDHGANLTPESFNSSLYSRVLDSSYVGKLYTEDEFKSRVWWFYPGSPSSGSRDAIWDYPYKQGVFGSGKTAHIRPRYMDENVSFKIIPSQDQSVKKRVRDTLVVSYFHLGKRYSASYEVNVDYRLCDRTCSETEFERDL